MEYRTDSIYRNTEVVNNEHLDVLNIDNIDIANTTTKQHTIDIRHNNKPDLLAHELYGNAKLWWVFALFNQSKLEDPIMDFTTGTVILVPTRFA